MFSSRELILFCKAEMDVLDVKVNGNKAKYYRRVATAKNVHHAVQLPVTLVLGELL